MAVELRIAGYGYRTISSKLDNAVSYNVVKNWVKDIPVDRVKAYELSKLYKKIKTPMDKLEDWSTSKGRRNFLVQQRGHKCQICNNATWLENPIPLELDHISGDRDDNSESNLRLLCPNCHALTPTYKGKNIGRKYII
jgi:5-methylcytosine-specific restriction endonuclease McrA